MNTTAEKIETVLKNNPKARRIAVENFCHTATGDRAVDLANLHADARSYGWNSDTICAISQFLFS